MINNPNHQLHNQHDKTKSQTFMEQRTTQEKITSEMNN